MELMLCYIGQMSPDIDWTTRRALSQIHELKTFPVLDPHSQDSPCYVKKLISR
jgi:hypothetical protein